MKAGPTIRRVVTVATAVWSTAVCANEAEHAIDKAAKQCQTIRANEEWQGSGVTVSPSDFVCVAAAGLWSHGGQGIQVITPFYGPEGFSKDDPVNIPEVVSRVGVLIGKIGVNAPFVIGEQLCFIPAATGELMLSMNDSPGTFGNNFGTMSVQIARTDSSSIPDRINLHPRRCRAR